MKDSVDNDGFISHFKIDPAVIGTETIKRFSIAGEMAKAVIIKVAQVSLGNFKSIEKFELIERIHFGNFRCANFVKDNL